MSSRLIAIVSIIFMICIILVKILSIIFNNSDILEYGLLVFSVLFIVLGIVNKIISWKRKD